LTWTVNGVSNGNSTVGAVSSNRYTAPQVAPAVNPVTIKVSLTADPNISDSLTLTALNPIPSLASVSPWMIGEGATNLTLNGSGFVNGAKVMIDGQQVAATYVSSTRITVAVNYPKAPANDLQVTVTNPDPGGTTSAPLLVPVARMSRRGAVSDSAARRFLEQATFGPDEYSFGRVRTLGFEAWIDEQFNEPISPLQDPFATPSNTQVQARFFTNAVHGRDQLRQRLAFALHRIWVVSGIDINTPDKLIPYVDVLQLNAFENYRTLMYKVTLNPAMGLYLSMVNNTKATGTTLPNENYAREFLQLFTIGLYQLNQDGSQKRDANGPISTYTQTIVSEYARVFTGWIYPTAPGATPRTTNPAYYVGEMEVSETRHDTGAKTLLRGQVLPAGRGTKQDLDDALNNAFYDLNVAPFICKNLIQQFVTSNPSPGYVERVATKFNDNGQHLRGDMKAVIKAILLDPEARAADDQPLIGVNDGRLKEPILFFTGMMRALNASVNDTNSLNARATSLGQNVYYPNSVFSYFSPSFRAPGTGGLGGPEFQGYTRTSAIERANQVDALLYGGGYGNGALVDFTRWGNLAATPSQLVEEMSNQFLNGKMPSQLRTELLNVINGTSGTGLVKARAALYVLLSSAYYSLQK
jgi:uncharacterized protein (DUF1800 family)